MLSVIVRCYAELNDDLPIGRRKGIFTHTIPPSATTGILAHEVGIDPAKIDLILVNGESADLSCELHDGDYVSMYPVFESFDITSVTRLRKYPLRTPRFVLDVHLGKLASHLRMFGFDTAFDSRADDEALVAQSREENRTLLSRDRRLLQHPQLTRKYRVQGTDPRVQVGEVFERFDLYGAVLPFTRCIACNALLCQVEKAAIRHRLPPRVESAFEEFRICAPCDRVYWKGSHFERMKRFVDDVVMHRPHGGGAVNCEEA